MDFKKLSKILKTKTLSESALTISATILNGILGLVFYMLIARFLGPSSFGVFAFTVATITLIADIGDLGTDTGLIRFIGKYINQREMALKFLKLSLEVKIIVWALVLGFGWFLSPAVAANIFAKPQLLSPLRFALLGVGGALFFSFVSHGLQAYQKYKVWSLLLIGSNLLRLILVIIVIYLTLFNLYNALIIYILVPLVFFVLGLFCLPNFIDVPGEFKVAKEFFKFNKWVFLISLIGATSARADTFLTTKLLPIEQVGIYSVAVSLTSFIPQLFFAIATVAAPKLANFTSVKAAATYLKKLQLLVTSLALLGLSGIPIGFFIITKFYGIAYMASLQPFLILFFAQILFLLALPAHQAIFYFFANPEIMVPVSAVQFITILILGWFLISSFGITGAALTVLIGNIILLVIPASWVILKFAKKND